MSDPSPDRGTKVVPLEPRQLGVGAVFYRTRDAVVIGEASSGRVVVWNDAAVELFGYTRDEAVGLVIEDLVPDALKERHRVGLARYGREGPGDLIDAGTPVELPARRKDGTEIWVEMSLTPLDPQGQPGRYAMAIARNATERKRTEAVLRAAHDEMAATVHQLEQRTRELTLMTELADLLQSCATTDEASAVIADMAARLFPGMSGALYLHPPSRNVLDVASTWGQSDTPQPLSSDDCWALRLGRSHHVDATEGGQVCPHVAPGWNSYLCAPLSAQGNTLGLLHLRAETETDDPAPVTLNSELAVAVADHVALAVANFQLRETLRNQSIRDPLTDLYNRRYMEESLEREVRRAGRHGLSLAIVAIDIDHFKPFNDTYGHESGDTLLRALADFLHAHVRAEDVACRPGGEEFLLILPYASLTQATGRAEELRRGAKTMSVTPRGVVSEQSVTISLGVAAYPEHGTSSIDLLRAADAALYRAKAEGRDRVSIAQPPASSPAVTK